MSTHLISGFLPWDELPEHTNRARKINIIALVLAILCFVIIPFIKVPIVPRDDVKVPERIARIIEKKVVLPPPPPKPLEVKKEEKKEAKPEEKPKVEKPKPIEKEPVAKAKEVKQAKEVAQKQISEVADALADLRDMQIESLSKPATGGLQKDNGGPAGTSRNMLTSKAGAGSGGVAYNGASSSGFGGGVAGGSGSKGNLGLGSKGTTNMQGKQIAAAGNGKSTEKTKGEGGISKRSQEDIRRIFDQNGARLYQAFQRALKDDPSMEGVVRLKLVIDPSGKVTSCEIASSDLKNAELESKIVALVRGFNFGADEVEVWNGKYPLNFYPQ
ncbi:MAG: energy transducer TonB [Moraxellaceae bacterium]|jgi:protein TonB|nr:energy transducer TonB [Moraxellaceae bacterium]MBK7301002.1 energy transducer TonB [Moraxellaceae bacterium]MBK9186118.1 energy transducer TonB [Moraxellaceae bacterium]